MEWNDDFGLGLNDYGARWYASDAPRWINVDPLSELRADVSPYQYVQNNPINAIDPTGMLDESFYGRDIKAIGENIQQKAQNGDFNKNSNNNQKGSKLVPFGTRVYINGILQSESIDGYNIVEDCNCDCPGKPPCPSVHNGNLLEDIKNGFSYSLRALGWMTKETATKVDKEVFDGAGADLNNGQYKKAGTSIVMSLLFSRMKYLKPLWTATSKLNSVKNAYLHWKKHQSDFPEFINAKQYVEGALQFLQNSPVGTLVKMRPNGDVLKYHPATNTFGVMDASGIPRTMFRPTDGINYWLTQ